MHESGLRAEFGIFVLVQSTGERCSILAFDQNTDLYGVWAAGPALANRGVHVDPTKMRGPSLACFKG